MLLLTLRETYTLNRLSSFQNLRRKGGKFDRAAKGSATPLPNGASLIPLNALISTFIGVSLYNETCAVMGSSVWRCVGLFYVFSDFKMRFIIFSTDISFEVPVVFGRAKPPISGQGWGPKGWSQRPNWLIAGMRFLGTGKLASFPPARGSLGALWAPPHSLRIDRVQWYF